MSVTLKRQKNGVQYRILIILIKKYDPLEVIVNGLNGYIECLCDAWILLLPQLQTAVATSTRKKHPRKMTTKTISTASDISKTN